jgi:hypothetical protein
VLKVLLTVVAPLSVVAPVTVSVPVADKLLLIAPDVTDMPYTEPVVEAEKPVSESALMVAFVMVGAEMVGLVKVLLVSVCVAVKLTSVSVTSGRVYVLVLPVVIPDS